jgi:type I restriction enzyme M protein
MLPMTVLRRFDCVLAETKGKVLAQYNARKDNLIDEALDAYLNKAAGQKFHNRSPLDFEKLKGDPDNIDKHLVSYIKEFSKNIQVILTASTLAFKSQKCAKRTFYIWLFPNSVT